MSQAGLGVPVFPITQTRLLSKTRKEAVLDRRVCEGRIEGTSYSSTCLLAGQEDRYRIERRIPSPNFISSSKRRDPSPEPEAFVPTKAATSPPLRNVFLPRRAAKPSQTTSDPTGSAARQRLLILRVSEPVVRPEGRFDYVCLSPSFSAPLHPRVNSNSDFRRG